MRPEYFDRRISPKTARELFRNSVKLVEIEVFSYCNRKCWFCPNAKIDRHSTNVHMPESMYLKILGELREVWFSGTITYSRYNEPLADRIILERIRQAHEIVPDALLSTHTNGDYLTRAYLLELRDVGLGALRIQAYLGNNQRFDDAKILRRMSRKLDRLGFPFEFVERDEGIGYAARIDVEGIDVILEGRNYDAIGLDRGQSVEAGPKYQRLSPCACPFDSLYIDHSGATVPCCNIRSDEPSHAAYVVDQLGPTRTIFDAYGRSALAQWRRHLAGWGGKPNPCATCAYRLSPPPD